MPLQFYLKERYENIFNTWTLKAVVYWMDPPLSCLLGSVVAFSTVMIRSFIFTFSREPFNRNCWGLSMLFTWILICMGILYIRQGILFGTWFCVCLREHRSPSSPPSPAQSGSSAVTSTTWKPLVEDAWDWIWDFLHAKYILALPLSYSPFVRLNK